MNYIVSQIEISGFLSTSTVDGPGVRSVVFFQGCSLKCKKCHNEYSQEKGDGILYSLDDLVNEIQQICLNKKLTISGGEPMEQYESLLELVKILSNLKFDVCLYTGWSLEKVPLEILYYLKYLKVGEFINELKNPVLAFCGSSNQKIYSIVKEDSLCLKEIEI